MTMQRCQPANPRGTTPAWADATERRASVKLCASVLVVLMVAKAAAHLPYLGPVALAGAAFWQLRAPLGRVERRGLGLEALGLSVHAWRRDLASTVCLAAVILPLYALGYHLWVTGGLGHWLPRGLAPQGAGAARWAPHWPTDAMTWAGHVVWFCERCATHYIGVAFPEELFYRGYLQPVWQSLPTEPGPRRRGRPAWWPAVAANAAFAVGHILGEWHVARLGPFFPGLLFAWQRHHSGTTLGCMGLHGLCNLFAEVWTRLYAF
jgi:membrane protease YdiL (CAAX protease family)